VARQLHTVQDLRSALRKLLRVWHERFAERRERGEMGGAIIYLTVYNELQGELDRVAPGPALPSGDFITPPDYRSPVRLWQLVEERGRARLAMLRHHTPPDKLDEWVEFTCDSCPHARCCKLAFDLYNTDGDCLAEK
jgi:hypothetical protein